MSDPNDENVPTESAISASEIPELREIPKEDWLLQDVVRFINQLEGVTIGMTFVVAGGIVTGDLISVKDFFYEYGKLWKQGFRKVGDVGDILDKQWREFGDGTSQEIKETKPLLFSYVHMKNARYLFGSTLIPSAGGMLWRGRISQVAGFSIGSFNPEQAKG